MGLITTTVPQDFVPPTVFNVFNFLRAGNALRNIPLTIALVGAKTSAGTGVAGQVYDVLDSAQTDGIAGAMVSWRRWRATRCSSAASCSGRPRW